MLSGHQTNGAGFAFFKSHQKEMISRWKVLNDRNKKQIERIK